MTPNLPEPPILADAARADARYDEPYIDVEEWRDEFPDPGPISGFTTQMATAPRPNVRHLYVHGGFTGTDAKFGFCFPPQDQYGGRFHQTCHQLLPIEDPLPINVASSFGGRAYSVRTNMGGSDARDPDAFGSARYLTAADVALRVNAAAAQFSRVVAQRIYGDHRTYGYFFGGSGGAFLTVYHAEHSRGIWDGFMPYVMGAPTAMINTCAWVHAKRVLKDKWPSILDAFEPGGGDPYEGLDEEQRAVLDELTRFGYPPRAWSNHVYLLGLPAIIGPTVSDPAYLEDFWTKPGYLGTDPSSSAATQRVQYATTIDRVIEGHPVRVEVSSIPDGDLAGADVIVASGERRGQSAMIESVTGNTIQFVPIADPALMASLGAGTGVTIDNSRYIALGTYYRHRVPPAGSAQDYPPVHDHLRQPDGSPTYPQRDIATTGGGGAYDGEQTGYFRSGKMLLVENLMDMDALPWQADWYRRRMQDVMGTEHVEENFRLWYFDHAQHTPPATDALARRVVDYHGGLQQGLRDLAAWVEDGVDPTNTAYTVADGGQIHVPEDATARNGIQPVVDLTANGSNRAHVRVGETVNLTATIEVPPAKGSVVSAAWDFEGTGEYGMNAPLDGNDSPTVRLTATHAYSNPGTYAPALIASSQREGDPDDEYARVRNLGRATVVVR